MNFSGSINDGEKITVSEFIGNPTYVQEAIKESLDGRFLEDLIFRDAGTNTGVVAYRESAAPFLNDDAENVAEFAEIPVSDMELGTLKSKIAAKRAIAVRASYECINFNQFNVITRQIDALQKTFIRSAAQSAVRAFDDAKVPEINAKAKWTEQAAADPATDVFDAIDAITGAEVEKGTNRYYDYNPDVIVMHPRLLNALMRADKVQDKYIGNLAADNPLALAYKGARPLTAFGLQIVESRYLPQDEVYVLESGTVGFRSDTIPLTVTGFYNEGAPAGVTTYGPFMSQRCDAVQKRVVAVDNPKAVIRIKGVAGD